MKAQKEVLSTKLHVIGQSVLLVQLKLKLKRAKTKQSRGFLFDESLGEVEASK